MTRMNKISIVIIIFMSWSVMSCTSSTEESEQSISNDDTMTLSQFEDELYLDSVRLAREDSLIESSMEAPTVVNREEVMKKLKPNEDNIITIDWNILNDIILNECFNETIGEYYWCPEFGSIVKELEGKTVALKGYILPFEGGYFVLSKNPMASCFFCGGSGPQSIVDLKFKGPRAFKMDAYMTFKGRLRLNTDNLEELFYVLDDADVYKTE